MIAFKLLKVDGHAVFQKTRVALQDQLEAKQDPLDPRQNFVTDRLSDALGFPAWPFIKMCCALAVCIATPALCWSVDIVSLELARGKSLFLYVHKLTFRTGT